MKVLITGGAGFIGSALAKELNKRHDVTLLDLKDRWSDIHSEFKKVSADIRDYSTFEQLDTDFDCVFHLAAQAGGFGSLEDPTHDCDVNAKGTLNVVRFCENGGSKKIVYTSSVAVYGEAENVVEDDPVNPISYYSVSKLTGEYYVKTMVNTEWSIVRLFNAYGVGQGLDDTQQGMLRIFLYQALNNDDSIKVKGSLDRVRDFVHVKDIVSAFEICLSDKTNSNIFNVCSGESINVKGLLDIITKSVNKQLPYEIIDSYFGDQFCLTGNNSKLRSFGWSPKVKLEDGIKEYIEYATK